MNHELVMLRGLAHCRRKLRRLEEESLSYALKCFSTECMRDGTVGQVRVMAQLAVERENLERYVELVKLALTNMPVGYRALIIAVYVKRVSIEELREKYHVSVSTVYRKLAKARKCFRAKLEALGCTEEWFVATYGNDEVFHALLQRPKNGARISE